MNWALTALYRTDPASTVPMPTTVLAKPYDWTYTTTYTGHEAKIDPSADTVSAIHIPEPLDEPTLSWKPADPENPSNAIPLAELSRPDPILFYAEVPLFEDELHDNGASSLLVRIVSPTSSSWHPFLTYCHQRVMPTCIFILSRFTLRVDNVLFRIFDTRIYHCFSSSSPLLVREIGGWESPYERVQTVRPVYSFLNLSAILKCLLSASSPPRRSDSPHRSEFHRKGTNRTAKIRLAERRSANRLERPWDQDSNRTTELKMYYN
jgi:hypothetical protein